MIAKWFESVVVRIAALVAALGIISGGAVALWPSPTIAVFDKHVTTAAGSREKLQTDFMAKHSTVAAAASKNTISRITWQQVLVEDALERARQRGDRQRVNQLKKQQKELGTELKRVNDQIDDRRRRLRR